METKKNLYLTKARYLAALTRFRKRLENGIELTLEDSTTPGDKHTEASWGLCATDLGKTDQHDGAWPDAEDHLFPEDFETLGRQSPKYRLGDMPCPFDDQELDAPNARLGVGCFYRCKLFNPRPGQKAPSRVEAIGLYRIRSKEAVR